MPEKRKTTRRKSDIPVVALEQFKDEMKEHVRQTIEITVNGGIRGIKKQLDDFILQDEIWKKDKEPALENMKNMTAGWKVILAFFGSIAVIAGGIISLKKLFHL